MASSIEDCIPRMTAPYLRRLICIVGDFEFERILADLRRTFHFMPDSNSGRVVPRTYYTPITYILHLETKDCRYAIPQPAQYPMPLPLAPTPESIRQIHAQKQRRVAETIRVLYEHCGIPSRALPDPPMGLLNENPLRLAIDAHNLAAARTLLECCAPELTAPDDSNLLHLVVHMNENDTLRLLASSPLATAFFNASEPTDEDTGNTALHEAARLNNAEAVALLIAHFRGDPERQNRRGRRPIDMAAEAGARDAAAALWAMK